MKISEDKLKIIDQLIAAFPNIVFGGSIALNALGLIDREVGDIDLFYTEKRVYSAWLQNQALDEATYENDVDMLGYITHRIGVKIGQVKICGFEIPEGRETKSISVNVHGRTINVQNPVFAIVAKAIYSDKTKKHAADLEAIQENLYKMINFYQTGDIL